MIILLTIFTVSFTALIGISTLAWIREPQGDEKTKPLAFERLAAATNALRKVMILALAGVLAIALYDAGVPETIINAVMKLFTSL